MQDIGRSHPWISAALLTTGWRFWNTDNLAISLISSSFQDNSGKYEWQYNDCIDSNPLSFPSPQRLVCFAEWLFT